ncbi:PREDICTED: rust resistance kinase Lr10 [Prunus dulcis]|uniref:PREDICTED: rust resistance kinase Lr10 n=1 Tax=Prunus dulcis TaxID=3755 RepID=A0A5E4FMW7_PRUDU|nr:PREDICTED: rust resistance kinase Lr10 [Prunus dulcis]
MKPSKYSYADIKRTTNQFKEKLAQGAYGTMFKGKLSSELLVAVKILNNSNENGEDYINEVGTMCQVHHVNAIRLVGVCADGFTNTYQMHRRNMMTTARGTMGYIAPEIFPRNFSNVSYKSEVYSFGILLLEMVGGRKNFKVMEDASSQVYFPEWIYNLLKQGNDLRIYIGDDEVDVTIARKLAILGLWCIQWHPIDRPSMEVVVQMLEREGENLAMNPNP